jgi:hypothetical protein
MFANGQDARKWLHSPSQGPYVQPADDTTITTVEQNRNGWVNAMVDAVYDINNCNDGDSMKKHFRPTHASYFQNLQVEAACQVLFDILIEQCRTGFRRLSRYDETKEKTCHPDDKAANCVDRAGNVVAALRMWKSICKGMIEEDTKKWQLVNAPLKTVGRKHVEHNNNDRKSRTSKAGKVACETLETLKFAGRVATNPAPATRAPLRLNLYTQSVAPTSTFAPEKHSTTFSYHVANFPVDPQQSMAPPPVLDHSPPYHVATSRTACMRHVANQPPTIYDHISRADFPRAPRSPAPNIRGVGDTINTHTTNYVNNDVHITLNSQGIPIDHLLSPFHDPVGGMNPHIVNRHSTTTFTDVGGVSNYGNGDPYSAAGMERRVRVAGHVPVPQQRNHGNYAHIGSKKRVRTVSMDGAPLPVARRRKGNDGNAND